MYALVASPLYTVSVSCALACHGINIAISRINKLVFLKNVLKYIIQKFLRFDNNFHHLKTFGKMLENLK